MSGLTQERVKEILEYRDDGSLAWKKTMGARANAGSITACIASNGYFVVRIDRKLYYHHRVIFLMHHGYMPDEIDHDDGNPQNNRIGNLRECTHPENGANKSINSNNTSNYKGVSWNKNAKRWHAQIQKDGKKIHLGYFDTAKEAHEAYCKAAIELSGEFARAA